VVTPTRCTGASGCGTSRSTAPPPAPAATAPAAAGGTSGGTRRLRRGCGGTSHGTLEPRQVGIANERIADSHQQICTAAASLEEHAAEDLLEHVDGHSFAGFWSAGVSPSPPVESCVVCRSRCARR